MLKDSIDNGPYQFKLEITVKDTDGVFDIHRPQRLEDLAGQDKLRYENDIKAVNILLCGFATQQIKADHIDALIKTVMMSDKKAIFMANLSPVGSLNDDTVEAHYDSDILSEVPHYDTYHDSDILILKLQEL
ncbi:hypothetical protein Tco_0017306 [Tanacetum coccineum]